MPFKVKEILLISSLYDAYAIEREGRFSEHMLGQYRQLNLTSFPRITVASSINQALGLLTTKHFDLIIYMVGVDKKIPLTVSQEIKKKYPYIPIFLLLNNSNDVAYYIDLQGKLSYVDHVFVWNGDPNIFFTMIKLLEDKVNVENDTRTGEVRVILLVEDSPVYYSRYLSFLYRVLLEQTRRIIDDVAADELFKILRLRARPKLLHAMNYEEAMKVINSYKKYMLCLITDVKFKHDGMMDENAGVNLLKYVKKEMPNLPTVLQSSDESYARIAHDNNSLFIYKESETLYQDFQNFITNYLGFGDFIFKDKTGKQIAVAGNMKAFENQLKKIPDESLLYHATRDHFSMWLLARGEIKAASIINPKKVSDFKSPADLRHTLLDLIKEYRNEQDAGTIIPYEFDQEITDKNIYLLIEGSLGGKGRGISFINALIENYNFKKFVPDINIRTPKTFIIGIQEFENFLSKNNLLNTILEEQDYTKIKKAFIKASLSEELMAKLDHLLHFITNPIAVRSSGLFEDSLNQPFAGIFDTYLLPNNHPDHKIRLKQAADAIKLVFASAFSTTARGYVKAINYKIDDEKMAVVIQEAVGNRYEHLYYPHISGVAQSYNFYPFSHMKPEEGFAVAAVGLGRYVVDGNKAYRFSPKYPKMDISSPKEQFRNSQVKFYAVDLKNTKPNLLQGEMAGLSFEDISVAEKHGALRHCASVYNPDSNLIYPGLSKSGPRIINFANILRYNYIPLAKTIEVVLELGKNAMGTAVEIEYAVDLNKDETGCASFYILQIKPLISSRMDCEVNFEEVKKEDIILYSEQGMGNGCIENVEDVIYIDKDQFDKSMTVEMAREIEKINEVMTEQKRKYILIGPGRWGTRDRWIGIPVKWYQISSASVIVETSLANFPLDASSGSHFFHNVTTMNVGYFSIQHESSANFINYKALEKQDVIYQGKYFRHVRFKKPLTIKMDGKQRKYMVHT
ncbi:MAG: pyruvate, phosphate dikinase [Chlorobi bacterium]|nr:pyruvate, phosphate dikinase [Chlorobiota bacterium]